MVSSEGFFGAFNVGFGGVAGFVRPVLLPMAEGAIESHGHEPDEKHMEDIKGMASSMENITWFFFQVLFVGGAGGILVQTTLKSLGYEVELIELAAAEIPIAIIALVVASDLLQLQKNKKLMKKYYGSEFRKNRAKRRNKRGTDIWILNLYRLGLALQIS